ncbi:MAG: cation transporter dimerization domain-containing protein [Anaerolineae bacterium]
MQAIAHSLGASAHEIWMHSANGQYFVELHLEVPAVLSLSAAHDLATQLEERGKQAMPAVDTITTHIEPAGETLEAGRLPADETGDLIEQARQIANSICGPDSCHNFKLWPAANMLSLSLHCILPAGMPIVEAHAVSQQVEHALRLQIPRLKRVTVHVEPPPAS